MKTSLAWLREFTDPKLDAAELGQALTMAGLALEGLEAAGEDVILDLAATTNRPDWLNHYGVAREAAAVTGSALAPPGVPPFAESGAAAAAVAVTIEAPEACGLYHARVFEAVRVQPSSPALARRLERLGHRAINNIADFTNYTLQELGHPTHAFDADRVRGAAIVVRYARAGETLVTLDEVERRLDPADLIIADAEGPIALAGVLGGLDSAIGPATRRVILESAWFHPLAVRRTAKRHGVRTEASIRFERGADPAAAGLAADRIAGFIAATGAEVRGGAVEARGRLPERPTVALRASALRRTLGIEIAAAEVAGILTRLGFEPAGEERWRPPSWRPDATGEADLVEEVARLYGYDRFPARLPAFAGWSHPDEGRRLRDRVRELLRGHGYAEAISLSFAAEAECRVFAPEAAVVRVLNPLSEEAAILRSSSLPGMLQLVRNNVHRGHTHPRLFEIGKLYRARADGTEEAAVVTLGACGLAAAQHWSGRPRGFDFFDLKGELESLFDRFQVPAREYRGGGAGAAFHPGRSAAVEAGGARLGVMGQIAPAIAESWKLPAETWLAEVDLEALLRAGARAAGFYPPSRFQASERDFSFLFPEAVRWEALAAALAQPPIPALAQVEPAEIFRSPQLGDGVYNVLLRARFQREDGTLRDDELQAGAEEITARLRALGGRQR